MARSSQLQAAWQVTGPSVNMCSVFTMGVGMSVSLSTRFSLPKTVRIPKKKKFFFQQISSLYASSHYIITGVSPGRGRGQQRRVTSLGTVLPSQELWAETGQGSLFF